jgi:hypothetical protein
MRIMHFNDGLSTAIDDPIHYLIRKVLPKLANKHLGIRKKFKSI